MVRPEVLFPYFSQLEQLSGIGVKTQQRLKKLCGETLIDLLFHLPKDTIDRRRFRGNAAMLKDGICTLMVHIDQHVAARRRSSPHRIHCHLAQEGTEAIPLEIVYFHARGDYLQKNFPIGERRLISGKLERRGAGLSMLHPEYIFAPDEEDQLPLYEPVYALTQGLSNRLIRKAIDQALNFLPTLPEWHRKQSLKNNALPGFLEALTAVHNPNEKQHDLQSPNPARRRLALDELLAQQLSLQLVRRSYRRKIGTAYSKRQQFRQKLAESLPFRLSDTQENAIAEIREDLHQETPMLRLLMGEVGSGKTLVALMVMLDVLESGDQCALMVPSETLARQHAETLRKLLDQAGLDIPCPLLLGSHNAKTRTEVLQALDSDTPLIAIGTHALIQDKVKFSRLGFVVIDEQHRFGVHQRLALGKKAERQPEMLVMTATPIPRTLLLSFYGDLDVSKLIGRNPNASPITTAVLHRQRLADLLPRIQDKMLQNHKVFWVCPLREETEAQQYTAAKDRYDYLCEHFPKQTFLLHGAMKSTERTQVMQDFLDCPSGGILVATTVIEVGIDIPQASIMIIEDAERFGLAQLHQLRGRVGRGKIDGYCVLLHGDQLSAVAKERLRMMRESDDGFQLAEADLRLRGGGEILGAKQSGEPTLRLAEGVQDQCLFTIAHEEAKYIVQIDPTLQGERGEALRTLLYLFGRDTAISLLQAG